MNIQELYASIDGDYQQAIKVLRIDKLIDKHIRKLGDNTIFADLFVADENLDGQQLFESSHAIKGVCANLGLRKLAAMASEISEEFRPGNPRALSDEEVHKRIEEIRQLYLKTVEKINEYKEAQ